MLLVHGLIFLTRSTSWYPTEDLVDMHAQKNQGIDLSQQYVVATNMETNMLPQTDSQLEICLSTGAGQLCASAIGSECGLQPHLHRQSA